MSTITPYIQKCRLCGLGKDHGLLEYEGNGIFVHFQTCEQKTRPRHPRFPVAIKDITVPICICIAKQHYPTECPYTNAKSLYKRKEPLAGLSGCLDKRGMYLVAT